MFELGKEAQVLGEMMALKEVFFVFFFLFFCTYKQMEKKVRIIWDVERAASKR